MTEISPSTTAETQSLLASISVTGPTERCRPSKSVIPVQFRSRALRANGVCPLCSPLRRWLRAKSKKRSKCAGIIRGKPEDSSRHVARLQSHSEGNRTVDPTVPRADLGKPTMPNWCSGLSSCSVTAGTWVQIPHSAYPDSHSDLSG